MRAVVCERFTSFQDLKLIDASPPELRKGCVRIAVHYASVSFAISLMVAGRYQRKMTLPFIPGTEVSGIIMECAPGVSGLKPGDPVAAIVDSGGYAEEVVVDPATVYLIPPELSLAKAVTVPLSFGTAATALERANIGPRHTVLVTGAGGALGLAAVQVAKLSGAKVIAAASSEGKLTAALAVGADHAVDYSEGNLVAEVKALTDGRGADVVFDPVGGAGFESLIRATAIEGVVLSLGFASGEIPAVPVNLLLVKNLSLLGVNFSEYVGWGKVDRRHEFAEQVQRMMARLLDEAASNNLSIREPQIFPFAEVKNAIESVVNRRAIGKVVIKII